MTKTKKEQELDLYSMQNAMAKLGIITKTIVEDSQSIYMKKPEDVDIKLLKTLSLSFTSMAVSFRELIEEWFGSKSKAIQISDKMEDRLDVKVYLRDQLDFQQLKKIMIHLNKIEDSLNAVDLISYYLRYYEDLCKKKGIEKYAQLSESFRIYSIEQFAKSLEMEAKQLRNQVERSNLYYQAKLSSKTVKIANVALVVSALSLLIAIILKLI